MTTPELSIVMPALDEAGQIVARLDALQGLRSEGVEIVVVDGGSRDDTATLAAPLADRVLIAPRGRARQMNAGAAVAAGGILLFLHVDTALPPGARRAITEAIAGSAHWGRFDVHIEGEHPLLHVVARLMNLRSRLTGIATGDQAMFVRRDSFERLGGFEDIPLMEDIRLSVKLKQVSPPACLQLQVVTSGRRWERHGVLRTILTMWWLRIAHFFGANPESLAFAYGYRPTTAPQDKS